MQILTPEFLDAVRRPIINIHHSFLPAFAGASPYARAYERGEDHRGHRPLRDRGARRRRGSRRQLLGHVVGGGPDDLHAALVRARVRVGAREGREERVVDVDDRRFENVPPGSASITGNTITHSRRPATRQHRLAVARDQDVLHACPEALRVTQMHGGHQPDVGKNRLPHSGNAWQVATRCSARHVRQSHPEPLGHLDIERHRANSAVLAPTPPLGVGLLVRLRDVRAVAVAQEPGRSTSRSQSMRLAAGNRPTPPPLSRRAMRGQAAMTAADGGTSARKVPFGRRPRSTRSAACNRHNPSEPATWSVAGTQRYCTAARYDPIHRREMGQTAATESESTGKKFGVAGAVTNAATLHVALFPPASLIVLHWRHQLGRWWSGAPTT